MQKKRQVQIDYDLFIKCLIITYGKNFDEDLIEEVGEELNKKFDALINRDLYSKYKTAPTDEEREAARKEYLSRKGYNKNFIW